MKILDLSGISGGQLTTFFRCCGKEMEKCLGNDFISRPLHDATKDWRDE
jgi:hypothetical protein